VDIPIPSNGGSSHIERCLLGARRYSKSAPGP